MDDAKRDESAAADVVVVARCIAEKPRFVFEIEICVVCGGELFFGGHVCTCTCTVLYVAVRKFSMCVGECFWYCVWCSMWEEEEEEEKGRGRLS